MALIAFGIYALASFQEEQRGNLLFEEYFSAQPLTGYTTQRSLSSGVTDTESSMLRQGIAYHQTEDYDLALVSLSAYLEGNPTDAPASSYVLAATAAIAIGHYAEGQEFLELVPTEDPEASLAANWHKALLRLRKEDFPAAKQLLEEINTTKGSSKYPVAELLKHW